MYFLFGWPKQFQLLLKNQEILSVKYSPTYDFVAACTKTTLYLLSGDQNRIILGYYHRSKSSIGRDGENEGLYWTSSTAVALTTRLGSIQLVSFDTDASADMLSYQFETDEPYIEFLPKLRMKPTLVKGINISQAGIAWLQFSGSKILVITRDGYLQRWLQKGNDTVLEEEVPLNGISRLASSAAMTPPHKSPKKSSTLGSIDPNQPLDTQEADQQRKENEELQLDLTIRFAVASDALKLVAAVTSTGRVIVILGNLNSLSALKAMVLPIRDATTAAINTTYNFLAVGESSGDVQIFNTARNEFKPEKIFSLVPWGITEVDIGEVASCAWTPDGRALAVGYSQRGISVWSISGCRLACTISQTQVIAEHAMMQRRRATSSSSSRPTPRVSPRNLEDETVGNGAGSTQPSPRQSVVVRPRPREAIPVGVTTMAWGPEGYNLLIGTPEKTSSLEQLNFVKTCLATNPVLNYCHRILLQGEDRLLLLYSRGQELGELRWKHLQLPSSYINDNWPVRLVSLSADGGHIAVCGLRGFALYNLNTGNWKLFGDRNEEQTFTIHGICWFRTTVVVTNYNESNDNYELVFFPRSRLALSTTLFRSAIPQSRKPLYVDCNDSYLVLFTEDNFFLQYKIIATGEKEAISIQLKLVQQVQVSQTLFTPTSMLLLPSNVQMDSQTAKNIPTSNPPTTTPAKMPTDKQQQKKTSSSAKCIVLDSSGQLALQNAEKSIFLKLAGHVEQFWMANAELDDLGNTLWAYGELGLEVWFPFFSQSKVQPLIFLSRDQSLEFDLEVYPIGFVPQWAVIVGISQGVSYMVGTDVPYFEITTKTQPFLHSVLRRMIEKGEHAQAIRIATKYSFVPHFSHSLELLLHETLEDEYSKQQKQIKKAAEVARILEFDAEAMHEDSSPQDVASSSSRHTTDDDVPTSASESDDLDDDGAGVFGSAKTVPSNASTTKAAKDDSSKVPNKKKPLKSSTTPQDIPPLNMSTDSTSEMGPSPLMAGGASSRESSIKLETSDRPAGEDLHKVCEFLKEFGTMFPQIVVSCARKTDPARWPLLFDEKHGVGKPRPLFDRCLANGRVQAAATYLRVFQLVDGELECRRAALKLVELCLQNDDLDLLRDLMRFLEPSEDTNTTELPAPDDEVDLFQTPRKHEIRDISADDEEYYMQEVLLARHARKLLLKKQLKALALYSSIVQRQLRGWLLRERKRAAVIDDFTETLALCHSQFCIPYPTHFPVDFLLNGDQARSTLEEYSVIYFPNTGFMMGNDDDGGQPDSSSSMLRSSASLDDSLNESTGSNGFLKPSRSRPRLSRRMSSSENLLGRVQEAAMIQSFRDLEYLLIEFDAAECSGWTLVLATLLFRVNSVLDVLEQHPAYWKVYKATLMKQQCKGYKDLLVYLENTLNFNNELEAPLQ